MFLNCNAIRTCQFQLLIIELEKVENIIFYRGQISILKSQLSFFKIFEIILIIPYLSNKLVWSKNWKFRKVSKFLSKNGNFKILVKNGNFENFVQKIEILKNFKILFKKWKFQNFGQKIGNFEKFQIFGH